MLPPTSFNETNSDAPGPEALVKAGNQPIQKQPLRHYAVLTHFELIKR